jgi:murein tripeptide amidase MpaA
MSSVAKAINSLDKKNSRRGSATVDYPITNASEFNAKVTFFDDDAAEISSPYTWAEVAAEFDALAAAEAANAYQQKRRDAYPDIGDQLDALFHAGVFPDDMAAKLQAVKDANPK